MLLVVVSRLPIFKKSHKHQSLKAILHNFVYDYSVINWVRRMTTIRKQQLATAQNEYRKRRRRQGFARLQTWLPEEAMQNLAELGKSLGLGQSEILELAIAKLKCELKTRDNEVHI